MSRVKFQHYVPRFYLERFCDAAGKVWVYDKKTDKIFCRKPERVGGSKFFYDVPALDKALGAEQFVEKFFQPYEGAASSILGRWLRELIEGDAFQINPDDRALFSMYLATQLIRTPHHRAFIMQMSALIRKHAFQTILDAEHPEFAHHPLIVTWDKKREPYFHAESICEEEGIERYAHILNSHIWLFVSNPSKHVFYTSDNPIIKRPHKQSGWKSHSGLSSEGIQLMFPLSPRYSLSLMEHSYWNNLERFDGKLGPAAMADENVEHDNSIQVDQSTRFLFCSEDDFSLARRYCTEFPDVREVDRPLVSAG